MSHLNHLLDYLTKPTGPKAILTDVLIYYFLYRFLRWLTKPLWYISPFQDVPGPAPNSWFMGEGFLILGNQLIASLNWYILGNLGQLFNAKGLPFHQQLADRYGGMVKVYGFFGVRFIFILRFVTVPPLSPAFTGSWVTVSVMSALRISNA
jgi:hypothetical protein